MLKGKDLGMKCAADSAPVVDRLEDSAVVDREVVIKMVVKDADKVADAVDNKNKKGCWES